MVKDPFAPTINFNSYGNNSKKRDKQPTHLKPATRQRWWGDKILGECFCCGRKLHYDDAEVGHIQAASKGGKWSPENCRLICRTCNSGMRTTNMKIYMKRYYPERYEKNFPKLVKIKRSENGTKKSRIRESENNPFGLPKFNLPKFKQPKFDFGI